MINQIGRITSWLSLFLVLLICTDVVLRYLFSATKTWVIELEWHIFGILFLLGAAYTFRDDQHVRVDVFYQKWSDKRKAWVNMLGILFFLIPWCITVIYVGGEYAWNSWKVREVSPDPGGLPLRYLLKGIIPLAFGLLLIEGLRQLKGALEQIQK